MDVARSEAAKAKEAGRIDNNEFNIAKNFLVNAVNAIQEATCSQYNIVICTDQDKDDFQNLKGQILPMDLLDVEVSQGKIVNFEVYVFDTGNYLRHGKYEQNSWWYWGQTKKWYDPAAMHVDFNKAQPKLDPSQVQKQQAQNTAQTQTATAANTATQALQATTAAQQAPALATDAASVAANNAQTLGAGAPAGAPSPAAPTTGYPPAASYAPAGPASATAPTTGSYGYPSAAPSYGSSPYGSGGPYGAAANPAPAPGLMDREY